ncbi:hypothetical protein [Sphingobacterium sp.]|uniref:hypothetical protein n=1 Tax=Sphingobacterium sp. TaxID=341027 RepID=UPI0028B02274|nr:hypothetical protein [Sphingobacterium sp.]
MELLTGVEFEPGWKGLEDRPRSGFEPGCPSTQLRVRDGRMGQDLEMNQDGGSTPLTQRGLEDRPRFGNIPGWDLTSPYLTTLSSLTEGQGTVR